MKFTSSLKLKLIYVFRINDAVHSGCLKIGEATCGKEDKVGLEPNSKLLNEAAKKRINQYTQTAGISYDLLYTEQTVYNKNGLRSFNDKEVHRVLERSGIEKKIFDTVNNANEWFVTDLETVKKAIAAVKEGRDSLRAGDVTHDVNPVIFRPEQRDAIEKTEKRFKKGNQMLWNAKMRFGKTLSALQVVKDMNFVRTLILTHRPVVDSGWFEDFGKIFYDRKDFCYGSKHRGDDYANLENQVKHNCKYVYFASMQDLRGSELVGGSFDKNDEVFATEWDLIIVDEAHEGTQTELGKAVMAELVKPETKVLRLSGTPFNLLSEFKEDEIYTWDYVMEQRAKASWDNVHFGDPNPYAALPTMNIYTYDLGRLLTNFTDDVAFNFHEFFRVNNDGDFIHKQDVTSFLNLLTKEDKNSYYPFANEDYRNIFRHTLWMVPGVKEAKALSALLQSHPVFQNFKIVNVAGNGDQEEESKDALAAVEQAIGVDPDATRTITLSCGRLTTGVSVRAWTAVLMLSGSYNTAASSYMQTIFRVQTPATINGRVKQDCYVFDFAPDRTLKVIAETAKISAKAGKTTQNDRDIMGEFLNFCPIISIEGSQMDRYDVPKMLQQLKKVYVERVVRNGFEDGCLYNDELMKLNGMDLKEFETLKAIIGQTKAMPKTNQVDINNQGLTNEQYEELEHLNQRAKSKKEPLTEEERIRLDELKKMGKNKETAVSILRGISIRMPLLIYGADLTDDAQISIDNFAGLIDDQSWEEFMPKGVTKDIFNNFKKYYDPEIFSAAGKRIREMALAADKLNIEERIERITNIFSTFRNPDHETVLTPWRVVNMHIGDCLGGYNFYDEKYENEIEEPRFVDHGEVTSDVFSPESRILEINSKSGLYPLYMAYGIYRSRVASSLSSVSCIEEEYTIWDKVVAENIFVICNTPMAKSITKRTLVGFRDAKVNTRYFEDLINQIKNKPENFISKVTKGKSYWKALDDDNMKFNAIVGNPPYQLTGGSGGNNDAPIYQHFVRISFLIRPSYCSMIMPSRWFAAGRENLLGDFRMEMLNCDHLSKMFNFINGNDVFDNVEIKGGICYFLYDEKYSGYCEYTLCEKGRKTSDLIKLNSFDVLIRNPKYQKIVKQVEVRRIELKESSVSSIISSDSPFGISSNPRTSKKNPFMVYKTASVEHNTLLYHIENQKRKIEYVNRFDIKKNTNSIDKIKVFIPGAGGSGTDTIILGTPEYAPSNSVCSQSYLYAEFENEKDAKNFLKYIKTRFLRALVSSIKITQSAPNRVYRFVPLQDFTENSDIDWQKSVEDIDKQLYAKYKLTNEEIAFIEKMIKPM